MSALSVPGLAKARYIELCEKYAPSWPATHRYSGRNSERAYVGDPGHCEYCAVLGHVEAHPDYGCGDVGCDREHA